MIYEIVTQALACMENYKVEREAEKFEMIYCVGRIHASLGHKEAMVSLNHHLDTHYSLLDRKPNMCYVGKNHD